MEQQKINNHSAKIQIEKLNGGFISDASGKRSIYTNSAVEQIEEDINLANVFNEIEEGEYILAIDLIPREQFVANVAAVSVEEHNSYHEVDSIDIISKLESNEPGWQKAVKDGIIQAADKFNPINYNPDLGAVISVGLANCYTIDELTKFDWKDADAKIPLTYSEKAQITGLKDSYLHNTWPKIISGTFQWTSQDARLKMTILAKYYQQKLDKKAKIESLPPRNDKRLMEVVTEIELMCKGGIIKSNLLLKKVDQFKKLLIQD